MIVDLFAGGGGASLGIEWALGRSPDIAVNHDEAAIAMHAANHPDTRHLCGDVFHYSPRELVGSRAVDLLWASPDCTHFSRAKGGKPRSRKLRGLAGVVVRWAREVRPRVILLENVAEFQTWGPLVDGQPDPTRSGLSFRRWVNDLRKCGYVVEWRELRACDFGAPTTRKRLFVVARCDGLTIRWPSPTHGSGGGLFPLKPFHTAADCIDWSVPTRSIFGREKPLAPATLARINRGMDRFVVNASEPYIVNNEYAAFLIQTGYGERPTQAPRVLDIGQPLGTVVAGGAKHALVCAFLAKHYGGNEATGSSLREPMHTITTQDHHSLVAAKVIVDGKQRQVTDIGMRMLTPRELFRAQGFPDSYVIDPILKGKPLSKMIQIEKCGNSVSPYMSYALAKANVPREQRAVA